jgi:hypothetical protein
MTAKAGEKAQKTGDFYCQECNEKHHVEQGETLPKCSCGTGDYDECRNEPGNASTHR